MFAWPWQDGWRGVVPEELTAEPFYTRSSKRLPSSLLFLITQFQDVRRFGIGAD